MSILFYSTNDTPDNDLTTGNVNQSHNSSHVPSIPSNSGHYQSASGAYNVSNVVKNETVDDDEDSFDDEDAFNQMLSEMPDFSRNESDEIPETTNQSLFTLTGSPLARVCFTSLLKSSITLITVFIKLFYISYQYHKNVLFGSEDDDNPVTSSQDIIVPESDEETN